MGRKERMTISATGSRIGKWKGFTLFEVVVVLVIIALVLTISFPMVSRALQKSNVRASARDVGTFLKYTRELSISRQEILGVKILKEEGKLELLDTSGKIIKKVHLPQNVFFYKIAVDGTEVNEEGRICWFYPDGRVPGFAIIVKDKNGYQIRLKSDIFSGFVRIVKPGDRDFKDEVFFR